MKASTLVSPPGESERVNAVWLLVAVNVSTVRLELWRFIKLSTMTSILVPFVGAASKVRVDPLKLNVSWCCMTPSKNTIALASTPGSTPIS